ncbi:MAG: hypothetical protein Q4C70_03370 [Planctomycetia bacterium]|nr:hypothetical protein [Planctomycetia bacterium]
MFERTKSWIGLFGCAFLSVFGSAYSFATDITSVTSGNWVTPSTWGVAQLPSTTDNAKILAGHTVTINAGESATARIPWVYGTLEISGTFTNQSSSNLAYFVIGDKGKVYLREGSVLTKKNDSGLAANFIIGSDMNGVSEMCNDGGTLNIQGTYGMVLGYSNGSKGYYTQSAGNLVLTSERSLQIGNELVGSDGRSSAYGEMNISGGTVNAPKVDIGNRAGSKGVLNISGNGKVTGTLSAANHADAIAKITLSDNAYLGTTNSNQAYWQYLGKSGAAEMTLNGGKWEGFVTYIGYEKGSYAKVTLNDGTISAGDVHFGVRGDVDILMCGGTLEATANMFIGEDSSITTLQATGGTITVGNLLSIGALGEMKLMDGTGVLYVSGNANLSTRDIRLGDNTTNANMKGYLVLMNGSDADTPTTWTTKGLGMSRGGNIVFMPGDKGMNTLQLSGDVSIPNADSMFMGIANGISTLASRDEEYKIFTGFAFQQSDIDTAFGVNKGIFDVTVNGKDLIATLNSQKEWTDTDGDGTFQLTDDLSPAAGFLEYKLGGGTYQMEMEFSNDTDAVLNLVSWLNTFEEGVDVMASENSLLWNFSNLPTNSLLAWDFGLYNSIYGSSMAVSSISFSEVPEPGSVLMLLLGIVGGWMAFPTQKNR